jgi:hypothetical protein
MELVKEEPNYGGITITSCRCLIKKFHHGVASNTFRVEEIPLLKFG